MKPRTITAIVVIGVIVGLAIFDFWALHTYSEATISEWFWKIGHKTFLVPMAIGALVMHLATPMLGGK